MCILRPVAETEERQKAEAKAKEMEEKARAQYEAMIGKVREESRAFSQALREQAGIVWDELIDPEGEAISCLAEIEGDAGALALATPLEMIQTETWLLGQIGDSEKLDFDIKSHKDFWFQLGALSLIHI